MFIVNFFKNIWNFFANIRRFFINVYNSWDNRLYYVYIANFIGPSIGTLLFGVYGKMKNRQRHLFTMILVFFVLFIINLKKRGEYCGSITFDSFGTAMLDSFNTLSAGEIGGYILLMVLRYIPIIGIPFRALPKIIETNRIYCSIATMLYFMINNVWNAETKDAFCSAPIQGYENNRKYAMISFIILLVKHFIPFGYPEQLQCKLG